MLKSMTGFGAALREDESYKISIEIKAVNQRFLETSFHMVHPLYPYEDMMRRDCLSLQGTCSWRRCATSPSRIIGRSTCCT